MIYGDWLSRRAALSPEKVAVLDASRALAPSTYAALAGRTHQLAHFLQSLGVKPGDRVAILAQNSVEWLELWFACGRIGAVLQALNWRLTPVELATLVLEATPRVVAYGTELLPLAMALRKLLSGQEDASRPSSSEPASSSASNLPTVLPLWLRLQGEGVLDPGDLRLETRETFASVPPEPVPISAETPWVLCYTGGTTGIPKAAILTHGAMTWNAVNTVMSWGLTPEDVTLLNAPLFHTGGMNVLTLPLIHIGGTSILCRTFDPTQVFDLIQDQGVSLFFGVPTMFITLQQHSRWATADFSRLKWVISGGAPCPEPVFRAFWARGVAFKTGYGLTEAGPNNFWLPNAEIQSHVGAVGKPLFHVDVCIMRADGRPCETGEAGELWIRGPHVCAGYYLRPVETAKTFVDGWLHTGDLAIRDADGYYSIVGRLKDVIISGGENIYPAEVENVLAGHPAVAEVALIGIPDDKWGEVGLAFVVVRRDQTLTAETLLAHAQSQLARYKLPRRVAFVESLPRTGAGKVDKRALASQLPEATGSHQTQHQP